MVSTPLRLLYDFLSLKNDGGGEGSDGEGELPPPHPRTCSVCCRLTGRSEGGGEGSDGEGQLPPPPVAGGCGGGGPGGVEGVG